MKRNARGFTLLEMLVVIVVISVVIGMITLVAGEPGTSGAAASPGRCTVTEHLTGKRGAGRA